MLDTYVPRYIIFFFKAGNTEPNATHKNQLLLLDDLLTLLQKEGDFERKG